MKINHDMACDHNTNVKYQHTRANHGYKVMQAPIYHSLQAINRVQDYERTVVVGSVAMLLHIYNQQVGDDVEREDFKMGSLYKKIRQTDDIDIVYENNGTMTRPGFKEKISDPASKFLKKMGYEPSFMAGSKNYSVVVMKQDEDNDALYINMRRMNKKYWDAFGSLVYHHHLNGSAEVRIPHTEEKVRVSCPEDVIAPKIILSRDKDKMDISNFLEYGPKIDVNRVKNTLLIWSQNPTTSVDHGHSATPDTKYHSHMSKLEALRKELGF